VVPDLWRYSVPMTRALRAASTISVVMTLQLIAGHFRPVGGAFPLADRQPRDAVAGAVVSATVERMTIQRMEHVGIVVDDLAAATAFFVELGLKLQGEGTAEGGWVDRVVGLEGVRVEYAMVETPDGHGRLELTKFHAPSGRGGDRHAPANTPGIRHVAFAVDDIDAVVASLRARGAELVGEVERYEDSYRLCYVRGPEGIIVELAEQIG
jgi:catechol 2,3-dioxygenase-like lactoylglutathione lyase family enzyme